MKCGVSCCSAEVTENDSFILPRNKFLKQWVEILRLENIRPTTRICKNHFYPSHIKKFDSVKLQLIPNAIPKSVNLPKPANLPIKRILRRTVVRTKANEVFVITEINDPIDLKIIEAQNAKQIQDEKNLNDKEKSENLKRSSPEKPFLITDSGIQSTNNSTSNKNNHNSTTTSDPQPSKPNNMIRKICISNLNQLKISPIKSVSPPPSESSTPDANTKQIFKVAGTSSLPQGRKLIKFIKNGKTYIKFLDSNSSICVTKSSSSNTSNSTENQNQIEIPMTTTTKKVSSTETEKSTTEKITAPNQIAGKKFVKIIRHRPTSTVTTSDSTITTTSPTTTISDDIPQIVSVTSLNPEANQPKRIKLESGASGSEASSNSAISQKHKEMIIKIREFKKKNFENKNKNHFAFTNIKNHMIVSSNNSENGDVQMQEKSLTVSDTSNVTKKRQSKFKLGCGTCNYIFPTRQHVDAHLETHHMKNAQQYKCLECVYCHEPFTAAKKRNFHMKESHTKRQMLTCTYCKVEFSHYMKFFKHISAHNDIEVCYICGDYYRHPVSLRDHIKDHYKQFDFSCFCGRNFVNEEYLKNHQAICVYTKNTTI